MNVASATSEFGDSEYPISSSERVHSLGESEDSSSAILMNKVKNTISLNIQSSSFSSALTAISSLDHPEKIDAKSIRSAIELDSLRQAKSLESHVWMLVNSVKDMRRIIKEILDITARVRESMSEVVSHESKSNDTYEEEKTLAAHVAYAFQRKNEAEDRYKTLNSLMERFDLSDSDSYLLENYHFEDIKTADVDESATGQSFKDGLAFLDALKRVTILRDELSVYSSTTLDSSSEIRNSEQSLPTFGPTSALKILKNIASKQERAFERLYHFLHTRLDLSPASLSGAHASTGNPVLTTLSTSSQYEAMDDVLLHPFVKSAILVLRNVPAYYKHTLEMISSNRRANGTKRFLLALTSGYDGMPPIEMKAHDPVNYVGDMLAFVFRAVSLESEMVNGLFEGDDVETNEKDDKLTAANLLNDSLGGIARPLKSRILQVISSLACRQEDTNEDFSATYNIGVDEEASYAGMRLSSLYSICGLLLFYHSAIEKVFRKLEMNSKNASIGESKNDRKLVLLECILESLEECSRAYGSSLKVFSAMLDVLANTSNESQSSVSCNLLELLCEVRSVSPGFGINVNGTSEVKTVLSLEFLFDTIFDPTLSSCHNIDDVIHLKRALQSANDAGLESTCATKWDKSISDLETDIIENQIATDTLTLLELIGLADVATAFQNMNASKTENVAMSSYPGLSSALLQSGISKFYESLHNPPLPLYENIKDVNLRRHAKGKVVANVIDVYRSIYDFAKGKYGCYSNLDFLVHDPVQVEMLLRM